MLKKSIMAVFSLSMLFSSNVVAASAPTVAAVPGPVVNYPVPPPLGEKCYYWRGLVIFCE